MRIILYEFAALLIFKHIGICLFATQGFWPLGRIPTWPRAKGDSNQRLLSDQKTSAADMDSESYFGWTHKRKYGPKAIL